MFVNGIRLEEYSQTRNLPPNLAKNHDHDLHGFPKKNEDGFQRMA
jgi:hypothetical protein